MLRRLILHQHAQLVVGFFGGRAQQVVAVHVFAVLLSDFGQRVGEPA